MIQINIVELQFPVLGIIKVNTLNLLWISMWSFIPVTRRETQVLECSLVEF